MGYTPNYSHLVGIMISKTIGCRGTLFSDKPIYHLPLLFGAGADPKRFQNHNLSRQDAVEQDASSLKAVAAGATNVIYIPRQRAEGNGMYPAW